MHPLPHTYLASASGRASGHVRVESPRLEPIATAAPAEFGGPGDAWTPEHLLCASVADCFILTFRAVSRAAKFEWTSLSCRVEGILDRGEGGLRFTKFVTHASLHLPADTDASRAEALLAKAEHGCLVANSLSAARELRCEVTQDATA